MKDFFKKNPQLLYTLITVLIVDGVIVWFCMKDNAATADKLNKLGSLRDKASAIRSSQFKTNVFNAKKAKENAEEFVEAFDEKFNKKLEQYKYKKTPEETYSSKPRALTNYRDLLEKLTTDLKDVDKTTDGLSFGEFQEKILEMEEKDINKIFEMMNGFSKIAHNCLEAGVSTIDSVERPLELNSIEDKDLGTKTYSFKVNLAGDGGSIKRLINLISSDQEYFFEISSISLLADKQISDVDKSFAPTVTREEGAKNVKDIPEDTLEGLEEGLKEEEPEEGEVFIAKESVAPFVPAVNRVELVIDWIQFINQSKSTDKKSTDKKKKGSRR